MKYDVSVQRTKWNCYNDSKQNNLERMNGQVLKKKKKKNLPLPEPSKTILPQRASGFSNLRKKE